MNITDDAKYSPEDAWAAFQEAAYEEDSRQGFISALGASPDLIDGVLGVAAWARKEALREAAAKAAGHIYDNRVSDYGDGWTENLALSTEAAILALAGGDN